MVTNSDEDDDSSSSLADIDEILRGTSNGLKPKKPQKDKQNDYSNSTSLSFVFQGRPKPEKRRPDRISLEQLVQQHKKHEKSVEAVARANALIHYNKEARDSNPQGAQQETLIDNMVGGDEEEDGRERLRRALKNTEALQQKHSWSFLDQVPHEQQPHVSTPLLQDGSLLQNLLSESYAREQALLGGCVKDYIRKQSSSPELLAWLAKVFSIEERDDIRAACATALVAAGPQVHSIMKPEFLRDILRHSGARCEALDLQHACQPSPPCAKADQRWEPHARIASALCLMGDLAEHLSVEVLLDTMHIVCRMLLDQKILENCNLTLAAQNCISQLAQSVSAVSKQVEPSQDIQEQTAKEFELLVQSITRTLTATSLQLQLLNHVPTLNFDIAVFRRSLAVAFSSKDRSIASHPPSTISINDITQTLQHQNFRVDPRTNYDDLTARIGILDICADAGDLSHEATDAQKDDFNRDVDRLTSRLRNLGASIVDTGPLNMGRTEAKEVIDSMLRRLSYAVRKQPPPRHTLLMDRSETFDSERVGMKGWMESSKTKATAIAIGTDSEMGP